ncbi:MAG: lycopene cyclase family protein [Cyclonatronaceae bacterium]
MTRLQSYDYIIAGAGCAGLSLAWFLVSSGLNGKKILIADQSLKPRNDKTWCFWSAKGIPDKSLIDHEWEKLEIRTSSHHDVSPLPPYGYYCVQSGSYHVKMMDFLRASSNIDWIECRIDGFETQHKRALLHTSAGTFDAEYLFQSIRLFDIDAHELNLKQHFTGWEIRTDKPVFNTESACFMDLSVEQREGITFMYILPYTKTQAIFEYTLFSEHLLTRDIYETEIRKYLTERYGLDENTYTVVRKEHGVIPMVDNGFRPSSGDRVINIGAAAGLAKASTGYTFTRIHSVNRQIVEMLRRGLTPLPQNPSSKRFRAYDILLLYIIKNDPSKAVEIFETLFKKNRLPGILKFLSEETHIGEEIKIFWSLPHRPFFKAMYGARKMLLKTLSSR